MLDGYSVGDGDIDILWHCSYCIHILWASKHFSYNILLHFFERRKHSAVFVLAMNPLLWNTALYRTPHQKIRFVRVCRGFFRGDMVPVSVFIDRIFKYLPKHVCWKKQKRKRTRDRKWKGSSSAWLRFYWNILTPPLYKWNILFSIPFFLLGMAIILSYALGLPFSSILCSFLLLFHFYLDSLDSLSSLFLFLGLRKLLFIFASQHSFKFKCLPFQWGYFNKVHLNSVNMHVFQLWDLSIHIESADDPDTPSPLNVNITEYYLYSTSILNNITSPAVLEKRTEKCFYGAPTM